jgi:hypothetical protein
LFWTGIFLDKYQRISTFVFISLIISPLSLLLFASPSQEAIGQNDDDEGASPAPNFVIFESPDYGLVMQYPSDWGKAAEPQDFHVHPWHLPLIPIKQFQPSVVDTLPEGLKYPIINFYPPIISEDRPSDAMTVFVEKVPFGTSLENYANSNIARIKERSVNLQILQQDKVTISDSPAIRIITTDNENEETIFETMRIFLLKGTRAYLVQFDAEKSNYDKFLPTVQTMIKSIQITSFEVPMWLIGTLAAGGVAVVGITFMKLRDKESFTSRFLVSIKRMYSSALGIEILCVLTAELGSIIGFLTFGFNPFGIIMSFILAYALAGTVTMIGIIGRNRPSDLGVMSTCCSVLEQGSGGGFFSGIKETFIHLPAGVKNLFSLHKHPDAGKMMKASLVLLVTAESGCIITAATVDALLYQYSILLSIPLALLAGSVTIAATASFKVARDKGKHLVDSHSHSHETR